MSNSIKNNPHETPTCCCLDMGTVINNQISSVTLNLSFSSKQEAEQMLIKLTDLAKQAESEPCTITSDIEETKNGWTLCASFNFCCQAETLIFQLNLRKLQVNQ